MRNVKLLIGMTMVAFVMMVGQVNAADIISLNLSENSGNQIFTGGEMIGPLATDSTNWNSTDNPDTGDLNTGTKAGLIDDSDVNTGASVAWNCSNTWYNNDGTGNDDDKMSVGYLDDGDSGSGNGIEITFSDVPYAAYRVYGLFSSDQSPGNTVASRNFDVNGAWIYGGDASTTALAWGSINDNDTNNSESWTLIDPGVTTGNYWTIETSGSTCTITGPTRNGVERASLTAVIIEATVSIAPKLIAPVGVENTPWDLTLEWAAPEVYTPGGYNIYLDPNMDKVAARDPSVKENIAIDPDPNYDVTGLTHGVRYYWLVEARQDPVTTPPNDPNWIPSTVASFSTLPDTVIITTHPVSQTVPETTEVTFTVTSPNADTYKWYKADTPYEGDVGTEVLGGNTDTLTLTNVGIVQEGYYYCEVANAAPSEEDSNRARLMMERLFAQWTFENTIDAVVGGFTGTYNDPNTDNAVTPTPVYDNTAPSPAGGYAIKFDGDTTESEGGGLGESISSSDPNLFNFYPQGVTASAWVKYAPESAGAWSAIVGKQNRIDGETWKGWGLIKNTNDRAVFTTRQASSDVTAGSPDLLDVNEDLDSTWHLVTGTYGSDEDEDGVPETRIYVDGNLEATSESSAIMDVNDKALIIGAERVDGLSPMNGLIDDVRIYTYGMSRYEVARLYTDQVPGAEVCIKDLSVLEFDFNDDCTTDLKDFAEFASKWLECYIVPDCLP